MEIAGLWDMPMNGKPVKHQERVQMPQLHLMPCFTIVLLSRRHTGGHNSMPCLAHGMHASQHCNRTDDIGTPLCHGICTSLQLLLP